MTLYLGAGTFKPLKSSDTRVSWFKTYIGCIQNIYGDSLVVDGRDIDKSDLEFLLRWYHKIIASGEAEKDLKGGLEFKRKISEMICALDDEQKDDLIRQMNNFVNVFQYYRERYPVM